MIFFKNAATVLLVPIKTSSSKHKAKRLPHPRIVPFFSQVSSCFLTIRVYDFKEVENCTEASCVSEKCAIKQLNFDVSVYKAS